MANRSLGFLFQQLRGMVNTAAGSGLTDAQLLERFLAQRDEAAFEVLLWRHGPTVWRVCRRLLRQEQDAEDAFQATFLVLARKAGSIGRRAALGSWLYKVAYRVALRARAQAVQRARREQPDPALDGPARLDGVSWELSELLKAEIEHLPARYREPFLLCCLEGKTQREAARQLNCPEGTIASRLAWARQRLRERLRQRGWVLSAGLLAMLLEPGVALPARLVRATLQLTLTFIGSRPGMVAAPAILLAEGVLQTMFRSMLKQAALMVVLGLVGTGAVLSLRPARAEKPPASSTSQASAPTKKEQAVDDRREMQGTWVSWETEVRTVNRGNGIQTLPPRQRKVTWVITADKITRVGEDGFIDYEWSYTLYPERSPKALDMISQQFGPDPNIYRLKGDSLQIAVGKDNQRPAAFPAKEESVLDLQRVSRKTPAVAARFANAPGCFWMIEPTNPPQSMTTLGIAFFYEKDADRAAVVTLASANGKLAADVTYRPVLLDAGYLRYLPPQVLGCASEGRGAIVSLGRWRMDPRMLPAAKVALVGIEVVPKVAPINVEVVTPEEGHAP
jgi:RNA polymerase sigma factor (sigma-70 family)